MECRDRIDSSSGRVPTRVAALASANRTSGTRSPSFPISLFLLLSSSLSLFLSDVWLVSCASPVNHGDSYFCTSSSSSATMPDHCRRRDFSRDIRARLMQPRKNPLSTLPDESPTDKHDDQIVTAANAVGRSVEVFGRRIIIIRGNYVSPSVHSSLDLIVARVLYRYLNSHLTINPMLHVALPWPCYLRCSRMNTRQRPAPRLPRLGRPNRGDTMPSR